MIASLSGKVQHKQPDAVILDVGGVGYEVMISSRTYDLLPPVGEEVFLLVRTNVREDAITLYGFGTSEEKKLFFLLNSVSGVGPKLALAILSGISAGELCQAISLKDMARLTALSGVGKKTAQRLCMELGEKVGAFSLHNLEADVSITAPAMVEGFAIQDAVSALVNLGYPRSTAWQALRSIQQQDPEAAAQMKVEELLRLALQAMA
ncbi:MAG TPA: Holliday junction branch migration protein RuvA [Desulfobulbaceae bacterium]|nr:Holliday junction branch migration protein RuvA [Desulfobulbaceae bacterium]HHD63521.1 Holliday junction branch migration protein RuvA [Desulfobulbaceae bacterium]